MIRRTLLLGLLISYPLAMANAINPRIVNGNAADRDTYPKSVVMVVNRLKELDCGGTLVSPTLVLTAAHCATGIIDYVMVGRYNTVNPLETFETIPIIQEIQHPQFDKSSFDFDVMLLQLEYSPTSVNDYMIMNSIDAMPPVGIDLTAMGWGKTQPNGSSDAPILQEVDLSYISNLECNTKEKGSESFVGKVNDNMICTFAPDADHCYGDSGGPLLLRSRLDPQKVLQVGIISWGAENCADGFFPGVGQRTSTSYEWISGVICAVDGEDPTTKSEYGCNPQATFSPLPSAAPIAPTVSPAPTFYTINVWIELHMDKWPEDIRWTLTDKNSGTPLAVSPKYKDTTDDIIVTNVKASPSRTYEFKITDKYGDGLAMGGFYQIRIGGIDLETAETIVTGNLDFEAVHDFTTPDQTVAPSSTFAPTDAPSEMPSLSPTRKPTTSPTLSPSEVPTNSPTRPPSVSPTGSPTLLPTTVKPTRSPSLAPSKSPTLSPTTVEPTIAKSLSSSPTISPTEGPFEIGDSFRSYEQGISDLITFKIVPFTSPTTRPTEKPTNLPTYAPTLSPTGIASESTCLDVADRCISWDQCCSRRCVIGLCARPDNDDSVRSIGEGPLVSSVSDVVQDIMTKIDDPFRFPSEEDRASSPGGASVSSPGEAFHDFFESVEHFIDLNITDTLADEDNDTYWNATEMPSSAPSAYKCIAVGGNCASKDQCCSGRCTFGLCAKSNMNDSRASVTAGYQGGAAADAGTRRLRGIR